jgi:hypothetical protein
LDEIDLSIPQVNRTTGPYYLRTGIIDPLKEKVYLLDTNDVFPYNVNETSYREVNPNKCLTQTSDPNNNILVSNNKYLIKNCLQKMRETKDDTQIRKEIKDLSKEIENKKKILNPLAIYHSGLGGTWSW